MCGLFACLLYPVERLPETWRAIQHCFTQGLLANETRGRDAAGVAVRQLDGRLHTIKQPGPANRLIQTAAYQELWRQVSPETTLILGHARYPTKGRPTSNDNNHPIEVGQVCGAHNGRVHNDDLLFAQHGYARRGQVDSEIIFHLLTQISPLERNGTYLTAAAERLRPLQGELTFLANDERAPGRLIALKHSNPISVHYHASWQALLFSSSYLYLRRAFGPIVSHEKIPGNQLMLFDAKKLPQSGHRPAASAAL